MSDKIRYPIGKFEKPSAFSKILLKKFIADIESFPIRLKKEVEHLNQISLDTTYREGGWTVRQVVHHCADSHLNAFCRHKLALTEKNPVVKPYNESRWAELSDAKTAPIAPSLLMLEGLHSRWSLMLKSLKASEIRKCFIHPEQNRKISLFENISMYAWHGNHHLAQITTLKKSQKWS